MDTSCMGRGMLLVILGHVTNTMSVMEHFLLMALTDMSQLLLSRIVSDAMDLLQGRITKYRAAHTDALHQHMFIQAHKQQNKVQVAWSKYLIKTLTRHHNQLLQI